MKLDYSCIDAILRCVEAYQTVSLNTGKVPHFYEIKAVGLNEIISQLEPEYQDKSSIYYAVLAASDYGYILCSLDVTERNIASVTRITTRGHERLEVIRSEKGAEVAL